MGQSEYAQNFVSVMLGWIRNIASSVASLFETTGRQTSSGMSIVDWFTDHWMSLLIIMILLGILIDWIVWMLRWRPYWLWFRRRRIVLDDDIDERLGEEELLDRYGARPVAQTPRFHSTALAREDDEPDEDLPDLPEDDVDDAYVRFVQDVEGWSSPSETPAQDAPEDDAHEDDENDAPDTEELDLSDPDEDMTTRDAGKKRPRLFVRRKRVEEDPFAMDDSAFENLDDHFYEVISAPQTNMDITRRYARDFVEPDDVIEPEDAESEDMPEDEAPAESDMSVEDEPLDFDKLLGYDDAEPAQRRVKRSGRNR